MRWSSPRERPRDPATPVDTVQPHVELSVRGRDPLTLFLPLLARKGPAVWRQDGDLELPVVYAGDPEAPKLRWEVALLDSSAVPLLRIQSRSAPLPDTVLLGAGLIPAEAVAAEVSVRFHHLFEGAPYGLAVDIRNDVRLEIPRDPLNRTVDAVVAPRPGPVLPGAKEALRWTVARASSHPGP